MEPLKLILMVGVLALALFGHVRWRRAAQRAASEARTDDLTGVGNARQWRESLTRLQRRGKPFAFVFFDVANLKAANTVLGHARADEILTRIGRMIRADNLPGARIGGDEFAIPVPTGVSAAEAIRDRVELALGEIPLGDTGLFAFVVGSVGSWAPGNDLVDRMVAADKALERRKASRKFVAGLPATRDGVMDRICAHSFNPHPPCSPLHRTDRSEGLA